MSIMMSILKLFVDIFVSFFFFFLREVIIISLWIENIMVFRFVDDNSYKEKNGKSDAVKVAQ